jgi:uncharacterized membrane protein
MENFSDGIMAIAITMMVLEMKISGGTVVNEATQWHVLKGMLPSFLIYLLSFVLLGVIWIAHHNLYDQVKHIDMKLLWLNLLLLFWLTLLPVATYFLGLHPTYRTTVGGYGFVMAMINLAFSFSRRYIMTHHLLVEGKQPDAAYKATELSLHNGIVTTAVYSFSVILSFVYVPLAYAVIVMPVVIFYIFPRALNADKFVGVLVRIFRRKNAS